MNRLAAKGHQHIIENFRVADSIWYIIKYSKYDNDNDLVFRGLDLGLVKSILCGIVEKHRLNNTGIYIFLGIYAHHRGQGSKETCATNSWNNLTYLWLTAQLPWGVENFINQRD